MSEMNWTRRAYGAPQPLAPDYGGSFSHTHAGRPGPTWKTTSLVHVKAGPSAKDMGPVTPDYSSGHAINKS